MRGVREFLNQVKCSYISYSKSAIGEPVVNNHKKTTLANRDKQTELKIKLNQIFGKFNSVNYFSHSECNVTYNMPPADQCMI